MYHKRPRTTYHIRPLGYHIPHTTQLLSYNKHYGKHSISTLRTSFCPSARAHTHTDTHTVTHTHTQHRDTHTCTHTCTHTFTTPPPNPFLSHKHTHAHTPVQQHQVSEVPPIQTTPKTCNNRVCRSSCCMNQAVRHPCHQDTTTAHFHMHGTTAACGQLCRNG